MLNVLIVEKTKTRDIEHIYVNFIAINWKKLVFLTLLYLENEDFSVKYLLKMQYTHTHTHIPFKTFLQRVLSSSDL